MINEVTKMINYFRKNRYKLFGIKVIHLILNVLVFYLSFLLFRYGSITKMSVTGFRYNYFVTLLYSVMMVFFIKTYNAYLLGYSQIRLLVFGQFISQIISIILVYMIVSLAWNHFENPLVFLPMLGLQLIIDLVWSYFGNILFYKISGKHKALLIYRNSVDKYRLGNIQGKPIERNYEIVDELQYNGSFPDIRDRLEGYDTIFVAGLNSSCRNGLLKYCKEKNVQGFFLPHIGDTIMQDAKHVKAFDTPVLRVTRKELSPEFAFQNVYLT